MKSFRRYLRAIALSSSVFSCVAVCEAQTPPTRIMALGDSLTSGVTSGTTVEGAYRNRLYSVLTTAGYNVDFVGTQTDVSNPPLPDRDHQGMGGYRIEQIQAGLPSWFSTIEDPDVVLLMIGTNDFSQNFNTASAPARLSALIADIAIRRPYAKIIVSSLPLRTDSASLEAQQLAFNAAIPGVINDQVALGRQVTFLDMHSVLLAGDFSEGVHPTAVGYGKMADAWLSSITSVIAPLGTSNPPAIVRTEPAVNLQSITVRFSKPLAESSTSLSNFSLDGGLTISQAALDPVTKRSITLTTSAQAAGKLYTLTVSGVRDRTPAQTLIAPGSTVDFSSLTLTNGSFEAGEIGWTMTGNRLNYASDGTYVATNGSKMMVLNGGNTPPNAIMSQTFTTIPGQYYVLSFDVGSLDVGFTAQQLGVSVIGTGTLVARIVAVPGTGQGVSVWSGKSEAFTADSTSTVINFQDQSATSNGADLLLDNVRIIAAPLPVNNPPVATAESYSTNQSSQLVVAAPGVLTNDSDPQGSPLTAVLVAGPSNGTLTLNSNGSFTYAPTPGYSGPDSFTYRANDGVLNSNVVTVSLTVNAVVPGSLVNGSFESGQTGWTMTGNFLVYNTTPPYIAFDGVTLVVMNGGQTPPSAVISQSFATTVGQSYVLDFNVGSLASNAAEQKLGVTVTGATQRLATTESIFGNGQSNSVWTAKSYSFTADSTSTNLTFQDLSPTSDGLDLLLDNVRITTSGPVNTAPTAVAESYATNQNTALVIAAPGVLANDTDPQSNPLTAVLGTGPTNGALTLSANGSFTYTPNSGYVGSDSFTYRANDGSLSSNLAIVSLTVNVVNTAPTAVAESYSTNQNTALVIAAPGLLANDTDPQSNPLTAILGNGPTKGALALNANGSFTYTPNSGYVGSDSFTYRANDGSLSSNLATVSLTVNAVNTAPTAVAESYSTNQNTALVIAAPGLLANDNDPQSNLLTAVLGTGPTKGSLTLNANGSFTYTPNSGYSGSDSFTYRANDGSLNSNFATVSITVVAPSVQVLVNGSFESGLSGWTASGNQSIESVSPYPPTDGTRLLAFNGRNQAPNGVLSQSFSTVSGRTYTLTFDVGVLSYVKKQQKLSFTVKGTGTSNLLSQSVTLNGNSTTGATQWSARSYTFVANSATTVLRFQDTSSFTEGIDLLLDKVRVVGPPAVVNAAPIAVADVYSVNKNTALIIPAAGVLANDTDPQFDALTAMIDTPPTRGTLALASNGSFTYTPSAGITGPDSFTYRANDGALNSNIATVSITVNEVVAGLLVNPSFESDFNGWTASGNQNIGYYPASDGIKIVTFNSENRTPDGVLSQTFVTTPGQSYSLSFDVGLLAYTNDSQSLQVSLTGTGNLLTQTVTLNGQGTGLGPWVPQSFSFTANSAATTLTFQDQSTASIGIDMLLDHVRVVALTAPSAPLVLATTPGGQPVLGSTPSLTRTSDSFAIRMTAPADGNYVLERSTDLQTWLPLATMECDAQQLIEFYDTSDALGNQEPQPKMFYRIGLQPANQSY